MDNPTRSLPPQLLRAARIAVLVQAVALLVVIGLAVPSFVDHLVHPISCKADLMCLDLRGFSFEASVAFLGLPTLLLLATYWLWRRPRRWPAVLPLLVDIAAIAFVGADLITFAAAGSAEPNILVQVLMILLPAMISLTLVVGLLRRRGSRKERSATV